MSPLASNFSAMKSILLIDGNLDDAVILESLLTRYGFFVEVAETAIAAQRLTSETQFDLLLMEFLPFTSGARIEHMTVTQLGEELGRSTAMIRELRARCITSPILVYSSLQGDLYETAALDAGADDYVLKTHHRSVLLARLNAHLRRRQRDLGLTSFEDQRTTIGRYIVDRRARLLFADDERVQLSSNEIAFLERLGANPYRIVSVREVLDAVWGDGIRRSEPALVALIKRLRKKMAMKGLEDPVQTVRGAGFRLSSEIVTGGSDAPDSMQLH